MHLCGPPLGTVPPLQALEFLNMATEIERKFTLKSTDLLREHQGSFFLQAYLAKGAVLLRVRVSGDKAWLTVKGQASSALSRPEWEYAIPVADAKEMASQPGAYSLEKTRFLVEHAGHTFEVDQYHGALEGLFSVEVEMATEDTVINLPEWVGEELTGNRDWDNESLARNGWPPSHPKTR